MRPGPIGSMKGGGGHEEIVCGGGGGVNYKFCWKMLVCLKNYSMCFLFLSNPAHVPSWSHLSDTKYLSFSLFSNTEEQA